MNPMADGLLIAWVLGIWGYLAGTTIHFIQAYRYHAYLSRARYRWTVREWLFDEVNRTIVKAVLAAWGIARLGLINQRPQAETASTTVLHLDLLTIALYWGMLLVLTHWTWRVRQQRTRDPEWFVDPVEEVGDEARTSTDSATRTAGDPPGVGA